MLLIGETVCLISARPLQLWVQTRVSVSWRGQGNHEAQSPGGRDAVHGCSAVRWEPTKLRRLGMLIDLPFLFLLCFGAKSSRSEERSGRRGAHAFPRRIFLSQQQCAAARTQ